MYMTTIRQGKKRRVGYDNRVQKKNPNKKQLHTCKQTAPTRFGKGISLNQALLQFILLIVHVRHQYYYSVCTNKLFKILTVV